MIIDLWPPKDNHDPTPPAASVEGDAVEIGNSHNTNSPLRGVRGGVYEVHTSPYTPSRGKHTA